MNLRYGWVMVGIGALMTCVAVGAMFSLAVFLDPMTRDTGWSRAGISSAMTLNFLAMGVAGFGWGALSDRYGPRRVVLAGAVLLGLGLALASRATSQVAFLLTYGLIVGISAGSFFAPMFVAVMAWFDRHRGLAVSLVSVGVGVAPLTISPLAAWLVSKTDWRTAQLCIACLAWALMIPAALFVRPAPKAQAAGGGPPGEAKEGPITTASAALRSPQFIVLALTYFACCATHSGPIFHTISYAIVCGVPPLAAVTVYSVEGLAGLGGRIALGLMADRFGVKRILIAGLAIQAFAAGAFVFASRLGEFYAVSAVFGFAYGGVMPLYAVLAREYFGQQILGTVLGAATMVSSLGMALGPLGGGWIFDRFGTYVWLYAASFVLGILAVAIALLFPPFPRKLPAPHPA
ncbi:MAG TPA: MFS transporter [Burkholderiales bacterium]|nr:MFS transporter [Burkholderiales bacterium]